LVKLIASLAGLLQLTVPLWPQSAGVAEPAEAMMHARKAYDLARSGQVEPAITELKEAARLAPLNPLYHSALGGMYERQEQLEGAVFEFAEAVRLDPANTKLADRLEAVSLQWGATLAREKRFRAGLAHAQVSAARFPKSPSVHIMLGLFETRNQQNVAAVRAYRRALELDSDSVDASLGLGMAQTNAGRFKEALATFDRGLQKFPKDAMHRQAYGALLVKMAESDEATVESAAKMLESALALDPSLAEAHYQLGTLALSRGDDSGAALHLHAAASNGLDDSRLHYSTSRALRRLGKQDEAARHLQLFRERKVAEDARSAR
jgi:Flp pilus assembly protein TadD